MARVKRAVNAQKKRRTVLESASGYRGQRSRLYRKAKEQMLHSMQYAYRDRRDRKGDFRQLWITRINAAARANGMTYNRLIQGLRLAGVEVDRKILADLAVNDAAAFAAIVELARAAVVAEGTGGAGGSGRLTGLRDSMHPARGGSVHATDPPGCCCPATAPPPGPRRGRPLPRRRTPGGPRGLVAHASSNSSAPPTRSTGTRTCAARAHAVVSVVTDDALAALAETVTPQGLVAVCRHLDITLADALARRPHSGRRARGDPRSGQRRHRAAHRRRRRRRGGGVRRRRRRPVQRQVRTRLRRQPVPPRRGPRPATRRRGRRAARCRAAGAGRRRLRRAATWTTSPTTGRWPPRPRGCSAPRRTGCPTTWPPPPTPGSGCRCTGGPRA